MMIGMLILAAIASGKCLQPDETTIAGQRLLGAGEPCVRRAGGALAPIVTTVPSRQLQLKVRQALDGELLDGVSARYQWPAFRGRRGSYCGSVNAKNRMGAFTGWRRFWVMYDPKTLKIGGFFINDERGMADLLCSGAGAKN